MYNRREIMKAAWRKMHRFGMNRSDALRLAWYEAKAAAPIWSVYGDRISMAAPKLIASGLTYEEARKQEWLNCCRYDHISIQAA